MARDVSANKLIQDLETELQSHKKGEWDRRFWAEKGLVNHRKRCVELLGEYKSIEAIPVLTSLYKYSNGLERTVILQKGLREIAHSSSIEFLVEVAQKGYIGEPNSFDMEVLSSQASFLNNHMRSAVQALCMIEDDDAHERICELVQNKECPSPYSILGPMFTYLGRSKRSETDELLVECLEIEYSFFRFPTLKKILSVISEYSGKEALAPLCKILDYKYFSENLGISLSLENHVLLTLESVVNRLTHGISLEDREKGLISLKGKIVD